MWKQGYPLAPPHEGDRIPTGLCAPPRSASPGYFSSLEMWLCASLASHHCQSRRVKLLTLRFFCDSKLIREQVETSYFVGLVFSAPFPQ